METTDNFKIGDRVVVNDNSSAHGCSGAVIGRGKIHLTLVFPYAIILLDTPIQINGDNHLAVLTFQDGLLMEAPPEAPKFRTVVVQAWEESERGWGVRPDGYTLHYTEADRVAFCKAYWDRQPKTVPDIYSRESGAPYLADVPEDQYASIADGEHGIWQVGKLPATK